MADVAALGWFTLTWSSVGGAAFYRIHYGTTSGVYPDYVQMPASRVSYPVTWLVYGTSYYLLLTAHDAQGVELSRDAEILVLNGAQQPYFNVFIREGLGLDETRDSVGPFLVPDAFVLPDAAIRERAVRVAASTFTLGESSLPLAEVERGAWRGDGALLYEVVPVLVAERTERIAEAPLALGDAVVTEVLRGVLALDAVAVADAAPVTARVPLSVVVWVEVKVDEFVS